MLVSDTEAKNERIAPVGKEVILTLFTNSMFPYSEGIFEDRKEMAILSSSTDTEQITPEMKHACVSNSMLNRGIIRWSLANSGDKTAVLVEITGCLKLIT